MRRSVGTVIATLVTVGAITAQVVPAAAVGGYPPASATCASTTGSKVCFEALGDRVWVGDTRADGHHAEGYLMVYGGSGIGTIVTYCENYNGAGSWRVCSEAESIPEHRWGDIRALTVEGSRTISASSWVPIATT